MQDTMFKLQLSCCFVLFCFALSMPFWWNGFQVGQFFLKKIGVDYLFIRSKASEGTSNH